MIKENELRIGNLVEYDGKYYQIYTIAKEFPTLNTDEFGVGIIDWNNINPIPLTEEILLKCGFKLEEEMYKGYKVYELYKLYLLCNDNDIRLCFYGCLLDINFDISSFDKVNFLHQLQNIIFCLTNQELKINL